MDVIDAFGLLIIQTN